MKGLSDDINNKIAEEIREALVDSLLTQKGWNGQPPLASGKLASSISVKPSNNGWDVYMEDYGLVVENGRQGHGLYPPIEPIKQWVKLKGIKPTEAGVTQEQVAWLIASSLRTSYIKPKPFITDGINAVQNKLVENVILGLEVKLNEALK